jgi:hypothetical protein
MKTVRIDYTVYSPGFEGSCWDLRTPKRVKSRARSLGRGARIYKNYNKDKELDWWTDKRLWVCDGALFVSRPRGEAHLADGPDLDLG